MMGHALGEDLARFLALEEQRARVRDARASVVAPYSGESFDLGSFGPLFVHMDRIEVDWARTKFS